MLTDKSLTNIPSPVGILYTITAPDYKLYFHSIYERLAMIDAATRIEQLSEQIRYHDRKYYVDADPAITDLEYDRLMDELKSLEAQYPHLVSSNSPTQRIGDEVLSGLQQVEHRVPMLSIENTYSLEELANFLGRVQKGLGAEPVEWVLELKIDGVAAAIIYEHGQMVRAVTRGDGRVGDDVTHNIRTIPDVPLRLSGSPPELLEVRGEVYMTNKDLALLNLQQSALGQPAFKNTRNVTAGTIRLLDPKLAAQRKMRFFCHGVGYCQGMRAANHMDFLAELRGFGLPVTPHVHQFCSAAEVLEKIDAIQAELHELDFEVDGLVLKVNRFNQRDELGSTTKSPRWVVAYKIEKYEAITRLNDISVQVGKTGTITPVAELEPVELAGTTVSRASLHNAAEIARKDIRVGDWVVVEKAGKIIPHVVRVELHRRAPTNQPYQFPTQCPECNTLLSQDQGGVYIRCTNPDCSAKFRQRLRYFAARSAMDIDGLGEKVVDQLVDSGLIENLADLYLLEESQLLTLEGFGKRKAEKLIHGIRESKQRGLARVLAAVSIRHVGTRVASILAKKFVTIDQLQAASVTELSSVEEIGQVIAESVHKFLHSEIGETTIRGLADAGVKMHEDQQQAISSTAATGVLAGKTLVVTGTLVKYKRDEIEALIESLGGRAASSISKNTDYLVVGENAGSKLAKAQQLGITILSEVEFQELVRPTPAH